MTSHDLAQPTDLAFSNAYDLQVAALTAAYHRTVDTIMTERYGPSWATRGDLPDHAYTTETVFNQWLSDLLDHIDATVSPPRPPTRDRQPTPDPSPFTGSVPKIGADGSYSD